MGKRRISKKISDPVNKLEYEELVEIVRGKSRKAKTNQAYNEIEKRIKLLEDFFESEDDENSSTE